MNTMTPNQGASGQYAEPFDVKWFTSKLLWGASLSGSRLVTGRKAAYEVPISGYPWVGLSIDPRSGFREMLVWFDNDDTPHVLRAGVPIARRFNQIAVATLYASTYVTSAVRTPALPSSPDMNRQQVALRLWRVPPVFLAGEMPPMIEVTQDVLAPVGAPAAEPAYLHVHAPGVDALEVWAHTNGQTNSDTLTVNVYGVNPAVDGQTQGRTDPTQVRTSNPIATFSVPGGLGLQATPVGVTVVNPAFNEYLVEVAGGTGANTNTIQVGARAYYRR